MIALARMPESQTEELEKAKSTEICRKRSFQRTSKDTSASKRTRVTHGNSTKVSVNPDAPLNGFPGEHLKAECGKLVCMACHSELYLKKSIILTHIKTERHEREKDRLEKEQG